MAIKKIFKKDNENNFYGLDFKDCYFKIEQLQIDPIADNIRIAVRGYINQESRKSDSYGIFKQVINCKFTDIKSKKFDYDSILTASYEYLKTLDEYKDGENV